MIEYWNVKNSTTISCKKFKSIHTEMKLGANICVKTLIIGIVYHKIIADRESIDERSVPGKLKRIFLILKLVELIDNRNVSVLRTAIYFHFIMTIASFLFFLFSIKFVLLMYLFMYYNLRKWNIPNVPEIFLAHIEPFVSICIGGRKDGSGQIQWKERNPSVMLF